VSTDVDMHGLLVVDKPLGWSSMDVVRRVRRAIALGREQRGQPRIALHRIKVGHAGTLDPLATGVVVCCVGRATRQVEAIMGGVKVYEAEVDLSAFTPTDDREGEREPVDVAVVPGESDVTRAIRGFVGEIEQRPPAFSAVHVDGRRAYKRARAGETLDPPPRPVRIDAIEVLFYRWPLLQLRITCGKGTYIRSIARDLGASLGTGGHLAALRRTTVGRFTLDLAIDETRLQQALTQGDLLPMDA
jgi:tRNA pseudouridine55 synthase